ncbi:putative cytochrome P450 monooxygenase [Xylariaceae sp. FL0804]|nr:putative cytochrome P450 monooxygenase [Xylariaceae sp. FL0804]
MELELLQIGTANLATLFLACGAVYYVAWAVYALFLHPLREYPGPLLHRVSVLPKQFYMLRGDSPFHVAALHARYGPVVRIGPEELAISTPRAWRDIYGHRGGSSSLGEIPKADRFYRLLRHMLPTIVNADRDDHAQLRRLLSPGFSDGALRGQEHIIGGYVDQLVRRLREESTTAADDGEHKLKPLNMRDWLQWCTFDIVGDLGFGSPFGCLDQAGYHPWVKRITEGIVQYGVISGVADMGFRRPVQWLAASPWLAKNEVTQVMLEKMEARVAKADDDRPDLIAGLVKARDKLPGGHDPLGLLASNGELLVAAGSETTATALCGCLFLLERNPAARATVVAEVRGAFASDADISLLTVGRLSYMMAVLKESLRRYPPVPSGLPRRVPAGGAEIDGNFVPEGTIVAVWQWAINHSTDYWTDPMTFAPERWMGDSKYADDQLDACQPFSVGPRNCIGQNLAYAEMRLILAKILYNFDVKVDDGCGEWLTKQKAYQLWDKPDLNCYLTPRAK